jgi:uncharacterized protein YacL
LLWLAFRILVFGLGQQMTVVPPPVQTEVQSRGFNYSAWIRGIAIAWCVTIFVIFLIFVGREFLRALGSDVERLSFGDVLYAMLGVVFYIVLTAPLFGFPLAILAIVKSQSSSGR